MHYTQISKKLNVIMLFMEYFVLLYVLSKSDKTVMATHYHIDTYV